MRHTPPDRRVITFYSYKGGVGRTMALANVAYRLADTHGLKVIAVDWDLEAPGLHRFFGISLERTATTNGVLDYFMAWREAVNRKDPNPPAEMREVMSWLIPVMDEKYKPRFGSVSLLLAGRQDKSYDERLAGFHWQEFYRATAGAVAVERLREQLTEAADVVLIDSRTGLTDIGGICTIQVPDGVVLMTAPNDQSLEGTERVARAIAKASVEERADRGRIRVWLAVSRVPSVEETYLAQQWFDDRDHKERFDAGVEHNLWSKDEHPGGLRSYEIPHRARWGFGEVPPSELSRADPQDLLVRAYERLTGALLRWLRGEPVIDPTSHVKIPEPRRRDVASLEAEAAYAERRGDTLGLAIVLVRLALQLMAARRYDEAIRKADQASGIFLSRGAQREQALALLTLGMSLRQANRLVEAEDSLQRALKLTHELENRDLESVVLLQLIHLYLLQGYPDKAEEFFKRTLEAEPNQANVLGKYALFLSDTRKDPDKAEQFYKRAIEADPKHANNLGEYALFLFAVRKDLDKAEEFFKRAIEADPEHANNLGQYALLLSGVLKDPDMAEVLKGAIEAAPKHVSNLGNYAFFLSGVRKDPDKAEEFYKRAIKADPKDPNNLRSYAIFLADVRKDPDKAEEFFKRALEADPTHADNLRDYAFFLWRVRDNPDKAQEFYKQAIEASPKRANNLGDYAIFLWAARGDADKAEEFFKRAIEADPKHVNTLGNYALFLWGIRKDPDKAEEFYKRSLEADPTLANNLGNYAFFLWRVRDNPDKAQEFYKRVIEADPKNANALGNYAGMLLAIGRQTEGLSMLDRALDAPNAKLDLRVECWFYAFAHRAPEWRGEALAQLKQLITGERARSPGWDFSANIERALRSGHPDAAWLALLADVISEKADPAVLNAWSAWVAA